MGALGTPFSDTAMLCHRNTPVCFSSRRPGSHKEPVRRVFAKHLVHHVIMGVDEFLNLLVALVPILLLAQLRTTAELHCRESLKVRNPEHFDNDNKNAPCGFEGQLADVHN